MSISPIVEPRWDADHPLPPPRSDRRPTMLHRIEHWVTSGLLKLFAGQSIEGGARRMGAFMETVGPLLGSPQRRGDANLRLVYPDMTKAERLAILRDAWRNLGMTVAEFAHLSEMPARVEARHYERLEPFLHGEKQGLFFAAHMANWEVLPAWLHAQDLRYAFVFRAANNPLVDADIIERRAAAMSRHQIPKGKRGTKTLLKAFKDGHSVCMLTDQKLNDGIESSLLGYPAMTTPAAARMALKENIPLVPMQIERQPGSRFIITTHEPIEIERTGDLKADTQTLTDAMNEQLGAFILDRPDQWLWFHRRWPKELA